MAYLDTLGRFSLDGTALPYQRIRLRGGQRDHVHEFPYVPGGLPERFGRKLYEVTVSIKIDDGIMRAGGFYQGRNLFTNMAVMRGRWEDGLVQRIGLPNIGEIRGYATSWDQELDVRLRSGETFEVVFREDQDQASLVAKTLSTKPVAALATALGAMDMQMPDDPPGLLQQLRDAVNQLLAFRDTAEMWVGYVADKILGLLLLFQEVDETLDILRDPLNSELLDAIHALWAAVQQMQSEAGELAFFVTPRDMDVSTIALVIYGSTAKAVEVMNLNPLDDPYAVPAGTRIRYLKTS